jgi:hypothetical protein
MVNYPKARTKKQTQTWAFATSPVNQGEETSWTTKIQTLHQTISTAILEPRTLREV